MPELSSVIRDEIDEQILTATKDLIAERGYDHVRLIDIADRAGVSVGSLQHRFRTRAALLHVAVSVADEQAMQELLNSTSESDDPWDALMSQLEHITSTDVREMQTGYWLELVAAAARNDDLLSVMSAQQENWLRALRENLERGLSSGRLRSELAPNDLAVAILALIDGLFASRVLGSVYQDPLWVRRLLVRVVGILVQPR